MPETWHHYAELHKPRLYRYRVADDAQGLRLSRNIYPSAPEPTARGRAWIGLVLVVGCYAYCVKWAHARMRLKAGRD
ncbi:hypothetical protein ACFFMN_23575 [Planobispora siamensis]|uniref:Uncharacterized protein n=1 Tax=Planobispora siamensis TaxID=936338 RepID=A0A8J3WN36_9ACTN|nr:hypothetical protein [Planobispora siamensis]GIH95345.1 hypothetical protein Psi01_59750 [Planobispora siamensis]